MQPAPLRPANGGHDEVGQGDELGPAREKAPTLGIKPAESAQHALPFQL
jgi:hypothetical protein